VNSVIPDVSPGEISDECIFDALETPLYELAVDDAALVMAAQAMENMADPVGTLVSAFNSSI
jgi:hypothetical protein